MRPPTAGDLEYHLSTLFPPVRPRGHFELRMIDAQPGDGWVVPLAVASALLATSGRATLRWPRSSRSGRATGGRGMAAG